MEKKRKSHMFHKESQWEVVCDSCHGTRFVGVTQNNEGYEFIECEKCHGTGYVSVIQFGFSGEDEE